MKYLILATLLISNISSAQSKKKSRIDICSDLTDIELEKKLGFTSSGLGDLHRQDDGTKFELIGHEVIANKIKKNRAAMLLPKPREIVKYLESEQQFFSMQQSKVFDVTNGGMSAKLGISIKALPGYVEPSKKSEYAKHRKHYTKYVLDCTLESSPTALRCKRNYNYASYLIKDITFDVYNKGKTSKCGFKGSHIVVEHSSNVRERDYKSFFEFVLDELLGGFIAAFAKHQVQFEDMSSNMFDDYLEKLYRNWTK